VLGERCVGVGAAAVVVVFDAHPAVSTTIVATRIIPRAMSYVADRVREIRTSFPVRSRGHQPSRPREGFNERGSVRMLTA
jgi:hypothetical protein